MNSVHPSNIHPGEAGFTLLELMVAMTLLGLLSLVLFGGLRLGTQIWRRTDDVTADVRTIRAAQLLLRDELSRAYPSFVSSGTEQSHADFDGDANGVRFIAIDKSSGTTARIGFKALGETGKSLAYESEPELSGAAKTGDGAAKIVLSSLRSLAFSYYGPLKPGDKAVWQSDWHSRSSLPQLIRIRAAFEAKGAPPWPELIVAPRIAADESCVFDPLTKFCQGR